MFLDWMVFAWIYMRLFYIQVLCHQIFKLSKTFPRYNKFSMLKVHYFLHVSESPSIVQKIIAIGIVFFKWKVVEDKLPAIYRESFSRDIISVFIFFCSVENLDRVALLHHPK
jgi:hypothetical protein